MGERFDGTLFYSMDGGETFRPLGEIREITFPDTAEEPVPMPTIPEEMTFPIELTYRSLKNLYKAVRHCANCQRRAVRRYKRKRKAARKAAKKARYA